MTGSETVAASLMVLVRMGLSLEERTHLLECGLVALLAYEALTERLRAGRSPCSG
ncbi:MAG: hypothetical protein P8L45_11495 [Longimicrobiales bacterium]|nr:hypothetical protein [Longimicrobiales bacterium]